MRVIATSIFVEDQDKAKQFYTDVLGFEVKHDLPMGEFRWLALVDNSSDNQVEVILEPNNHKVAKDYQKGLYEAGIPVTMFGTDDLNKEVDELKDKGVKFQTEPVDMDGFKFAIFDDSCGNLIQLLQQN
nr:VOC family protein [Mammaliicoccus sp. Marseille-Q6498]